MHDLTTRLTSDHPQVHARSGHTHRRGAALADLGIDGLDLPMICLDLEDAYGAQIVLEDEPASVGDLIARVVASLAREVAAPPPACPSQERLDVDRRRPPPLAEGCTAHAPLRCGRRLLSLSVERLKFKQPASRQPFAKPS